MNTLKIEKNYHDTPYVFGREIIIFGFCLINWNAGLSRNHPYKYESAESAEIQFELYNLFPENMRLERIKKSLKYEY